MRPLPPTLVCFAVKEEAAGFHRLAEWPPQIRTLVTGMGRGNAAKAVRAVLVGTLPGLVLTCGFAGGLRPGLAAGTVVFAADPETSLESALQAAGAQAARFHCVQQVVTTARQKQALWEATGADAVEMESHVIREICRERRVPSATVRIILDAAEEDLPLDFNALMTPDQRLAPGRLARVLAGSPGKIGALLRLRKQSRVAADLLARVLRRVLVP